MLDPKRFRHRGGYKLFKPLYYQAGKIREIQVNLLLLTNPDPTINEFSSFIQWLREEERYAIKKFIREVKKFREAELEEGDKAIQKICNGSSTFKLRSKTMAFVKNKAGLVISVKSEEPGEKEIHQIRKHLKTMSAITALVYSIKPVRKLDVIITALNKTEMMIGEWHDRVVLTGAIDRFLLKTKPEINEEQISLNRLRQEVADYNQNLVRQFMPEVNSIVQSVLTV